MRVSEDDMQERKRDEKLLEKLKKDQQKREKDLNDKMIVHPQNPFKLSTSYV